MRASKFSIEPQKPLIVGTVHSASSLRRALRLRAGEVDVLELRVDHFAEDSGVLLRAASRLKFPLIVTVRHGTEGGAGSLAVGQRRELFMEFLPFAAAIDVELRSARALAGVIAMARRHRVKVIVSSHHFTSTPSAKALASLIPRAVEAGAEVVKVATLTTKADDVAKLLGLFSTPSAVPVSAMGMGRLGKASRLLFAQAGSVLNYGYLDQPNASGQWEATLLKKRVAELR